jgi:C4-dicarboxylate-specific signal transduction histidine kinase
MEIPRAPLAKNSDGSLVFAGSIREGEEVTFGYGNLQVILHSGQQIYDDVKIQNSESIFIYSCMARLQLLGKNVDEEMLPLQSICSVSGFFTYGEFFVEESIHEHELLNETMTILALSENTVSRKHSFQKYDYLKKIENEQSLTLKALSHLVSQSSQELEDFNARLRERVREEVMKNIRKDRMLLQQTKLAQMGEMISMIAHQWRQPLSSISTLSQTINLKASMGKLDKENILRLSSSITDTAMHLSQTIDDFREFFKPRKEKRETSYTEIVESVLQIIGNSIITKNIKIIKELHACEKFNSYPNEIKQVVLNLLKNAQDAFLEAEVENPYILIRSFKKEGKHILEICDNAGGVPKALKAKIFEPYFSTKKKKDGTGLGLYMSKTIIEEHCNGKLCVENSKEGAVFHIELPAMAKETDA